MGISKTTTAESSFMSSDWVYACIHHTLFIVGGRLLAQHDEMRGAGSKIAGNTH